MPLSVVPTTVNEPKDPTGATPETAQPTSGPESGPGNGRSIGSQAPLPDPETDNRSSPEMPKIRGSRWVDYDTYELLEMISELEDERRWARLREGIWIAILVHLVLLSGLTWIPKYIFKVPPVVDPFDAIRQRKDELKYLDLPPDLIKRAQPRAEVKPVPKKAPQIDKKTLEALNKANPPVLPPTPAPRVEQAQPAPPPPPQPKPESQPQLESPVPKPAPQRPTFAMGSQNPADQLRDAMRGSRGPSNGSDNIPGNPDMARHPGAGGGVQVLSDTQGVDFNSWLRRWYYETEHTWDPLIPDEVNPPILKQGQCMIRFKVGPDGRVLEMHLEGRSGDTALDRAAWGAITGSNYPPLPREFHGPYLELRAIFMYNLKPQ
ncbi:MAG TPA: energy transducer TonB [Bryobacteraceae bacterium]|nr:energy transducer TonB [Bryobacteraceae bacterium]